MNEQHLRLSDVERDQAAAVLGEHYAQGRLTPEEHYERLDRIWAARTRGELAPVFSDLPSPSFARPASRVVGAWPAAGAARRRGVPTPLLVLLAVLLVVTVLTHLPIILIGLLLWFFVISRVRRHAGVRRW